MTRTDASVSLKHHVPHDRQAPGESYTRISSREGLNGVFQTRRKAIRQWDVRAPTVAYGVVSDSSGGRIRHLDQTKNEKSRWPIVRLHGDQLDGPFERAEGGWEWRPFFERERPHAQGLRDNKLKLGRVTCAKAQYIRLDKQRGRNKETGVGRRELDGRKGGEKKTSMR
jgi:hypothetical protein